MDVEAIIAKAGGTVELARRLGVARVTVLNWKREGTLPGARIGSISELLGISADELIKLVSPPRGGSRPIP